MNSNLLSEPPGAEIAGVSCRPQVSPEVILKALSLNNIDLVIPQKNVSFFYCKLQSRVKPKFPQIHFNVKSLETLFGVTGVPFVG